MSVSSNRRQSSISLVTILALILAGFTVQTAKAVAIEKSLSFAAKQSLQKKNDNYDTRKTITPGGVENVHNAILATGIHQVDSQFASPINDSISAAIDISDNMPYNSTLDNMSQATSSDDDPGLICKNSNDPVTNTVWYRYTAPADGSLSVNTDGSDFNTILAVWEGSPGNLTPIGCNDDIDYEKNNLLSILQTDLLKGQTYYIEVAAYGGMAQTLKINASFTPVSISYTSDGVKDGWLLESSRTSGKAGTLNSTSTTFNLGDATGNKQYRSILSFNTSSLPDNAIITAATLKIKRLSNGYLVGNNNPFSWGGGLKVDLCKNMFGTTTALQLGDYNFNSATNCKLLVTAFGSTAASGWYSASIPSAAFSKINLAGLTQFRLRFKNEDNNDSAADYVKFYSGNASAAYRPLLIVEYSVP